MIGRWHEEKRFVFNGQKATQATKSSRISQHFLSKNQKKANKVKTNGTKVNLDALLPLGPNSLNTDFFSYIIAAETRKKGNNKATSISYIRSSAEDSPQPERHMFENVASSSCHKIERHSRDCLACLALRWSSN